MKYQCLECKKAFEIESSRWKCDCGGLLSLSYEKRKIDFEKLRNSPERSLWRYIDGLPFDRDEECWKMATMGEGGTPLFQLDPTNENLYVKAEYYSPTLSFKDRGAVTLMALAKKLGVKNAVADSSGNGGTAISAYGARLGIHCDVFVTQTTSEKKVSQSSAHGAAIHKIPGSREDAGKAARNMVEGEGMFYASHIYNPFFHEGIKTYFYEVFEQMGFMMPDAFIIPVGNGTMILGAYAAFEDLLEWGYIKEMPRIIGVQAENCSPIAKAFEAGMDEVIPCEVRETLAEGIAIAAPPRGRQILQIIRATKGDMIAVDEESLIATRKRMAQRGVYVEITSASNYAAYEAYLKKYPEFADERVVIPLCGAGIKSK
jgi:threonine synthase